MLGSLFFSNGIYSIYFFYLFKYDLIFYVFEMVFVVFF